MYCPKCESRDAVESFCSKCHTPRVARDGTALEYLACEERAPSTHPWLMGSATTLGTAALGAVLFGGLGPVGALLLGGVGGGAFLARQIRSDPARRRRQMKSARRGLEVAPIANWLERAGDAPQPVAVRGKVRIVDPVVAEGDACAARVRRELKSTEEVSYSRGGTVRHTKRWLLTSRRVGRFSVADDSGVAWIDDDAVLLAPEPVFAPGEPGETRLLAGDEIEVYGNASAAPMRADVRGEEPASYREAGRMLEFCGSPTAPLLIVRLGGREAAG
ncbi:MAG: hypothetical protein GXP55_09850 [Deltaproteobacteria bacterium]|nr:hypothetical protein [Deltaproteobacteria bacterium]